MSNPIEEAITALRHGDQPTAFALLRTRLADEPKDAVAWLWMSEATPDVRRKVEALTRFLQLAPNHPHVPSVRLRLQQLQGQLATLPPEPHTAATDFSLDNRLPVNIPPPSTIKPPPLRSDGRPSLRDRISTAPQPVLQTDTAPITVEPSNEESTETASVKATMTPAITPRPAAPPPPNFQPMRSQADEDDGLPLWVWGLMGLTVLLIGLFLYVIFNFERFAGLFG